MKMHEILAEMAFQQKHAKNLVTDLSPLIVEHLIKIIEFDSPEWRDHWIIEVNAWLKKINGIRLKSTRKKPAADVLYQWIINESAPYYDAQWIELAIKQMLRQEYRGMKRYGNSPDRIWQKIEAAIHQSVRAMEDDEFTSVAEWLN